MAQFPGVTPGPGHFFRATGPRPAPAATSRLFETLDFRVSAQCKDLPCNTTDSGFNFETNFFDPPGRRQRLPSQTPCSFDYVSLTGPVGGLVQGIGSSPHPILLTARIPLTAFGNAPLTNLRGVRFTFDDTRREDIHIGNIRLSRVSGVANSIQITTALPASDSPLDLGAAKDEKNTIASVKATRSSQLIPNQSGVEIELTSNREFLPKGEMLVLKVGSQEFNLSRYGEDGSTNRIIFTLTAEQWSQINTGDPVVIQYGSGGRRGLQEFRSHRQEHVALTVPRRR